MTENEIALEIIKHKGSPDFTWDEVELIKKIVDEEKRRILHSLEREANVRLAIDKQDIWPVVKMVRDLT